MKRSVTWTAPPEKDAGPDSAGEQDDGIVWLMPQGNEGDQTPRAVRAGRVLGQLEQEIHDTVLQDLLCLGMGLSSLRSLPLDEATRQEVIHLQQMASQAYDQLRALLHGRSTTVAPPRRMREVLTACVRAFRLKSGASVELEIRDSASSLGVSGDVARQAELIIHEALCNAWRHARAESIRVVLTETADIIWVKVIDDGKGFDTSLRRSGHYGLRIMRERADAIGARVGVSSAPGKGTCVNLYLPSHHSNMSKNQEVPNGYSFAGRR